MKLKASKCAKDWGTGRRLTRNVFQDDGNNRQRYNLKFLPSAFDTRGLLDLVSYSPSAIYTRIASRAPKGKAKRSTHYYIHEIPVVKDEIPQPRRNQID